MLQVSARDVHLSLVVKSSKEAKKACLSWMIAKFHGTRSGGGVPGHNPATRSLPVCLGMLFPGKISERIVN